MSRRKYPYPCANPLCRQPIQPDQAFSLTLRQAPDDHHHFSRSWDLCDVACLTQYLALVAVKGDVDPDLDRAASRPGGG